MNRSIFRSVCRLDLEAVEIERAHVGALPIDLERCARIYRVVALDEYPLACSRRNLCEVRPCAVDISREAALVCSGLDSEGYMDRVSCVVADVDCVAVVSIIAFGVFETPVALISVAYDLLDGAVSRTACDKLKSNFCFCYVLKC